MELSGAKNDKTPLNSEGGTAVLDPAVSKSEEAAQRNAVRNGIRDIWMRGRIYAGDQQHLNGSNRSDTQVWQRSLLDELKRRVHDRGCYPLLAALAPASEGQCVYDRDCYPVLRQAKGNAAGETDASLAERFCYEQTERENVLRLLSTPVG